MAKHEHEYGPVVESSGSDNPPATPKKVLKCRICGADK